MPATPFDSAILSGLFDAGPVARLFTDNAEIRAMMLVEAALAREQAAQGVLPEIAAAAIARASVEAVIDPAALGSETAANGVSVPAFVAAFRKQIGAPEHAQHLHRGATSQDIQDTALMLRLRQALALMEEEITATLEALAVLAGTHAETAMAARTYGQHATPTSFGAVVASWGWPLIAARDALGALRAECLLVSLSGAAGTSGELGPDPAALRAAMAERLGLTDPGHSWHTDRTPVLRLADWMTRATLACGKLGEDLILAVQSGIGEVRLGSGGSSSTMPQKQNPVAPSALVALARHVQGLNGTLQGAALHRQQRDGAAWFTEWLVLPQLILSCAAALGHARRLAEAIRPDAAAMRATLDGTGGLILAEALSFRLANDMPRPEAQAAVKALVKEAQARGETLEQAARAAFPGIEAGFFDPAARLGQAPSEANAFVAAVRAPHGKENP